MDYLSEYYTNITSVFIREFFSGKFEQYVLDSTGFYRKVNPTVEACLWTADIVLDSFQDYMISFLDPIRIAENLGYHLGIIYDRYFEVYTLFSDDYVPTAF